MSLVWLFLALILISSLLLLNLTISEVKLKEPEYTIIYAWAFSFRNHISIYVRCETPHNIELQFSKSSSCNIWEARHSRGCTCTWIFNFSLFFKSCKISLYSILDHLHNKIVNSIRDVYTSLILYKLILCTTVDNNWN